MSTFDAVQSPIADLQYYHKYKALEDKFMQAKSMQDESLTEMARLELINITLSKELRLCKDYMKETEAKRDMGSAIHRISEQKMKEICSILSLSRHKKQNRMRLELDTPNKCNTSNLSEAELTFTEYKQKYTERANETLLDSNFWSHEEGLDQVFIQNTDPCLKEQCEYLQLLDQNDTLKGEVHLLESESKQLLETSKDNKTKIDSLLKTLSALKVTKPTIVEVVREKPVTKLNLEEMEWTSSCLPTDEGFMTKRSTNFTDKGLANLRYYDNDAKQIFKEDLQFEGSTYKDCMSMKSSEIFDESLVDSHYEVEQLIYELRQEYQLSEADVTQIKLNTEKSPSIHQSSILGPNLCRKIDKDQIKSNLFLNLINQKLSNLVTERSSCVENKWVSSEFSKESSASRSKALKQQRMDMSISSSLFSTLME